MAIIKFIEKLIFGNVTDYSLSERIYIAVSFIISLSFFVAAAFIPFGLTGKLSIYFASLHFILSIIFGILYYFSRVKHKTYPNLFISIVIIFTLFFVIIWGGLDFATLFSFVPIYIIFILISKKLKFWQISLIVIINILLLFVVDYKILVNSEPLFEMTQTINYLEFVAILFFSGIIVYLQRNQNEQNNSALLKKNEEIQTLYNNVQDSVKYGEHIQKAILPSKDYFSEILNDFFILFLPKDNVSGDFYWVRKVNNRRIVVAADCTGHGVPGAFMSVLGMSLLNEIVVNKKIVQTHEILEELRISLKKNFTLEAKEGMDMSIIAIDEDNSVQFSGANSEIVVIKNNELIVYKGDKQPVGNYIKEKPFTSTSFKMEKDDILYMFSDGYKDQIGGEKNFKFLSKNFKELLFSIHNKPLSEQQNILLETFIEWKDYTPKYNISYADMIDGNELNEESRAALTERYFKIKKEKRQTRPKAMTHTIWDYKKQFKQEGISKSGFKVKLKRMKEIFIDDFKENSKLTQKTKLHDELYAQKLKEELSDMYFELNKKNKRQLDDVLVIGIKF